MLGSEPEVTPVVGKWGSGDFGDSFELAAGDLGFSLSNVPKLPASVLRLPPGT